MAAESVRRAAACGEPCSKASSIESAAPQLTRRRRRRRRVGVFDEGLGVCRGLGLVIGGSEYGDACRWEGATREQRLGGGVGAVDDE